MLLNPYRFGVSTPGDPYFSNVGFLLHFDGTNGDTTAIDSGPRSKTLIRYGGGQISTAESVFGGASWDFSNGSAALEIAQDTTYITAAGLTPWTWECRVRALNFSVARVLFDNDNFSTNTTGWQIYIGSDGKFYIYNGASGLGYGGYGSAMSTNTWYGLAVTWDGSNLRFFINGVLVGTDTGFSNVWGNGVYIGNSAFASQGWSAFMDEMRWTKGVARYTASYSLESAAFPNY